jgi:hypothetical protein
VKLAFLWSIFAYRRDAISNLQSPLFVELIGLERNGRKAHIRAGLREHFAAANRLLENVGAAQEIRVKY